MKRSSPVDWILSRWTVECAGSNIQHLQMRDVTGDVFQYFRHQVWDIRWTEFAVVMAGFYLMMQVLQVYPSQRGETSIIHCIRSVFQLDMSWWRGVRATSTMLPAANHSPLLWSGFGFKCLIIVGIVGFLYKIVRSWLFALYFTVKCLEIMYIMIWHWHIWIELVPVVPEWKFRRTCGSLTWIRTEFMYRTVESKKPTDTRLWRRFWSSCIWYSLKVWVPF